MLKKLRKDPGTNGLVVVGLFFLTALLGFAAYLAFQAETKVVIAGLERIPIVRRAEDQNRLTWAQYYSAHGAPLYVQCQLDSLCRPTLSVNPLPTGALGLAASGVLAFILAIIVASLHKPGRQKLDEGLFLDSMSDEDYEELPRFMNDTASSPLAFAVGAPILVKEMLTPTGETRVTYQYQNQKLIGLPDIDLNEHLIVDGGTGNGKTSSVIFRILLSIALNKQAAVLPDVKYGEDEGGLIQAVKLFYNLGLLTYVVTPFEQDSVRIPIFDSIHSVDDGRAIAKVLFPLEDPTAMNAYYIEAQQNILACILFVVAQSQVPNMKEVMRIISYQRDDMEQWAKGLRYPEVRNLILGITTDQKIQYGGFRQGLLNALDPFHDPRVVRTFTSKAGQNLDVDELLEKGGLAYVGIPKDVLRGGRGQRVFMIIDNHIVSEALRLRRVAKDRCKAALNLIYDEADKLGTIFELSVGVSMFRTSRIRYIFGFQNRELMIERYGKNRWEGIEKLVATKISFPAGLKDEAAQQMSQYLGQKEYTVVSTGVSRRNLLGMAWDADTRKSQNQSLTTRPILTQSQVMKFPKYIAVLRVKSALPPIMVPMVAVNLPQASFISPDGKRFTRKNDALYETWTAIMGAKSGQEHYADIQDIIKAKLAGQKTEEPASLEDHFIAWVSGLIETGAEVSVRREQTEINWLTLSHQLRNVDVVAAFIQNGWLTMKDNLLLTPEDWSWIGMTKSGVSTIGPIGQAQLRRIQYLGPFMTWHRNIASDTPELASRAGEQIIMPQDAARNVIERMINREAADLSPQQVSAATDDVLEQLEKITQDYVTKRVIPFKFNFESAIRSALRSVREAAQRPEADWLEVQEHAEKQAAPEEGPSQPGAYEVDQADAAEPGQASSPAAPKGKRGNLQNLKQNRKAQASTAAQEEEQQAANSFDDQEREAAQLPEDDSDFTWGR